MLRKGERERVTLYNLHSSTRNLTLANISRVDDVVVTIAIAVFVVLFKVAVVVCKDR